MYFEACPGVQLFINKVLYMLMCTFVAVVTNLFTYIPTLNCVSLHTFLHRFDTY